MHAVHKYSEKESPPKKVPHPEKKSFFEQHWKISENATPIKVKETGGLIMKHLNRHS